MISLQKIRQHPKLILIVAALCTPLLILAWLFANQGLKAIGFTEKELIGTAYLRAAWSDLSTLYVYSDTNAAPVQTVGKKPPLVSASRLYNDRLGLESPYDDLQRTLDGINYPDRPLMRGPATDSAITRVRLFMTQIADASNLTLDPHIDTYYLMNATVTALPDVNQHSSAILHDLLTATGEDQVSEQEQADINTEITLLRLIADNTDSAIGSAIRGNTDGHIAAIEIPALNAFDRAEADFLQRAKGLAAQVTGGHALKQADIDALRGDQRALQKATDTLWTLSIDELDRLLKARIGMAQAKLWGLLALAGLVSLAALGLTIYLDLYMQHVEIMKLNATLQQSNTELERFAYICSHDMQEPVRMMNTYAGLLEDTATGTLDADSERYVRYIRDNAVRMQKMIRDILTFSRIGREDIRMERVDSQAIARMVLAEFQDQIAASAAQVTCDILPVLTTNPTLVSVLFQNLISNALKFQTGDKPPEIHISSERIGDTWRFDVRDNGIGMDPAHHDRIFTLFQRLNRTEDYPGTGIGLSTCRKFIRLCGGDISFVSTPGDGTTFSFTLPARP